MRVSIEKVQSELGKIKSNHRDSEHEYNKWIEKKNKRIFNVYSKSINMMQQRLWCN